MPIRHKILSSLLEIIELVDKLVEIHNNLGLFPTRLARISLSIYTPRRIMFEELTCIPSFFAIQIVIQEVVANFNAINQTTSLNCGARDLYILCS